MPFAGVEAGGAGAPPIGEKAPSRACGALKIVSAPSPLMALESGDNFLYGLALSIGPNGPVSLFVRERVKIAAEPAVQLA